MGDAERITGTLMEMGFSRPQIEKAIAENEINNVETIMEWLLSNGNDENNGGANQGNVAPEPGHAAGDQGDVAPARAIEENKNADANENVAEEKNEEVPQENAEANCFVCDECQKKFKTPVEVEFHAVKSGHQSFSESVEEIKPLTEEEIAEKKRLLEEKIRLRRKEKAEKDRQEAIQKEKVRRRTGQEVALSKQKIQEAEIKRLAEERRREKMEERLARQRVKEQIEKDRQARKEKFGSTTAASASASASASTAEDKPPAVTQVAPKKDYDQCRLQIRLTNGTALSQSFGSKEPLSAVRLYVEMHRSDGSDPFLFMTTFPRKVFTEDDMEKPLLELGLVPSAVLILTKPQA